jgi:hypothetical protein
MSRNFEILEGNYNNQNIIARSFGHIVHFFIPCKNSHLQGSHKDNTCTVLIYIMQMVHSGRVASEKIFL